MYELPKVFVVPAEGVKMPLPVDGMRIPEVGMVVTRTMHIERLLRNGDLVEGDAAEKLAAPRKAKADEEATQNKLPAPEAKPLPPADLKVQQGAAGSKG